MPLKKKSDKKSPPFEAPDNDSAAATQGAPSSGTIAGPGAVVVPVTDSIPPIPAGNGQNNGQPLFTPGADIPGLAGEAAVDAKPLDKLTLVQLLELRADIDKLLPPTQLSELDLEHELVLQYHAAVDLRARTLSAGGLSQANYAAAVINACSAALKQVVDLQTKLHDSERVKAIEFALERAFVGVAINVKEDFFARYKAALLAAADAPKRRAHVA